MKRVKMFIRTTMILLVSSIVCFCMAGCAEEENDDLTKLSLNSQKESTIENNTEEIQDDAAELPVQEDESTGKIYVYVCGAVEIPGVYEMPDGARVFEALECAGGLSEEAAHDYLNQAQILVDGEQIYVPTQEEVQKNELPVNLQKEVAGITEDGKVDINLATKEELMTLSGIGESRAESILEYRESQGEFQSIEDLMKVDGIKEGIYEKIKDSITVTTGS